jgi:dTDP-glucose 4,6-dehydratase
VKTVLVTGGFGFIGSNFIRQLLADGQWRVFNLDKLTYAGSTENLAGIEEGANYGFAVGDIADAEFVNGLIEKEKPSAIVNFAAESHVDRSILDASPFLETNIRGVQVLMDAARNQEIGHFIQISTDEVYGDAEDQEPFDEGAVLNPSSPYSASKASAELLCGSYRRTYGLPVSVLRSSNNYGPYQFPEKFIPVVIYSAANGKRIPVYGDGMQRREWLHVDDNCKAIIAVLNDAQPGATYNVGTGTDITNLDVVHAICRIVSKETGSNLEDTLELIDHVTDRPGHDRRYAMNVGKIQQELRWSPRLTFEQGLSETVRWYLQNPDWAKRMTSEDYRSYSASVYEKSWAKNS